MNHNNNKNRITFSTIALAIAATIGFAAPAHSATATANDTTLVSIADPTVVLTATEVAKATIVSHVDLISDGERLWTRRALTQLVQESHLRNDLVLKADLDRLVERDDIVSVERALTGVVVDFMRRHGFESADPKQSAERMVAALQSMTLDQFFAAELDSRGVAVDLRRALARYNAIAVTGDWAPIPAHIGKDEQRAATDISDDHVLYAALQERLSATGDWRGSSIPSARLAATNLEFALKRYQTRHQLPATGALDAATLDAMNVSVYRRIATLQVNLERATANPSAANRDGVTVNIPAFRATYLRDGEMVWDSDVIVGRHGRETPLVESAINTVVMNPNWWVPRRIARNYILPKVKSKPGYIRSRGFQVLDSAGRAVSLSDSNWKNVVATAQNNLRFRQLPGPQNALGEVKFLFPNRHSVYLHDTNARHLFEKVTRAFSSGCVRLAKPMELARVILEQQGIDAAGVNALDASNKTHKIALKQQVPVRTVYFTADVAADGTVQFYNDIYGRDGTLVAKAQSNLG